MITRKPTPLKRKPLEVPFEVAQRFVRDMKAFHAGHNAKNGLTGNFFAKRRAHIGLMVHSQHLAICWTWRARRCDFMGVWPLRSVNDADDRERPSALGRVLRRDLLPNLPSFIMRVCSGFGPCWGGLRTRSV